MNDQVAFLKLIASRLDSAGIPYMLTGSVAMSFYAEPRMTRDIDLVVECKADSAHSIVQLFKNDCYISPEAVSEAISGLGMFNIIHLESVMKADFIVRKDSPFRRLEFERKKNMNIDGFEFSVVTAEDLFLSKLQWWKESDSAMQQSDLSLLKTHGDFMDWDYIADWATRLHLGSWLEKLES
jgi:hypothetical protein